jgi:hypothetical protein
MLAIEESKVREKIEDKLDDLGSSDPIQVRAWMQYKGLVDHIADATDRMFNQEAETQRKFESQSLNIASYMLICFLRYSYAYFDRICGVIQEKDRLTPEQKIYWRHRALSNLIDNWEAISPVLLAAHDPELDTMGALVLAAEPSRAWLKQRQEQMTEQYGKYASDDYLQEFLDEYEDSSRVLTLPYRGRRFGLLTFEFAPGVSVMRLPVYDLRTPWGWHVVWHEMAGHIVNRLTERGDLEAVVSNVDQAIQALGDELPEETWQTWIAAGHAQPDVSLEEHTERCRELVGDDPQALGSCVELLADLEAGSQPTVDRTGWIAELLEDAYGAVSLGPGILSTLKYVLRQHYRSDDVTLDSRHPPVRLRLAMLGALLMDMLNLEVDDVGETVSVETHPVAAAVSHALDEELIKVSASLKPVAGVLRSVLVPEFVDHPFDPNLHNLAEDLAEILSAGEAGEARAASLARQADFVDANKWIRAIVMASSRALELKPGKADDISGVLKTAVGGMTGPQIEVLRLPESDFFAQLLDAIVKEADGSLEEILARNLVFEDDLSPTGHGPHTQKVWLSWDAHNVPHSGWHYLRHHK